MFYHNLFKAKDSEFIMANLFVDSTENFPQERGLWKVLSRKTFTGKYGLKLHIDKVIQPNGKEGIYEWAEPKLGASVLPIDNNDFIYLAKTFAYAGGVERLFAPGGGIEKFDGTPRDTAIRELTEELGIIADNYAYLGSFRPIPGVVNCPQEIYLASGIKFTKTHLDSTERIKLEKMKLEEAFKYVMDPSKDIFDGQTDWAIMKTYFRLNR